MKLPERPPEDPESLGADCHACPLKHKRTQAVLPQRPSHPALAIIGETPSHDQEQTGSITTGGASYFLQRTLHRFGVDLKACHKTNAILCRPDRKLSTAEWKAALTACRPRLLREFADSTAPGVLALGGRAQVVLHGKAKILDWMGTPTNPVTEGFERWQDRTLSTLHPSRCVHSPAYGPILTTHVGRLLDVIRGTLEPFSWPDFAWGDDTNGDLIKALERIQRRRALVCPDVETAPSDPLPFQYPASFPAWTAKEQKAWLRDFKRKRGPRALYDRLLNIGLSDDQDMVSLHITSDPATWAKRNPRCWSLVREIITNPDHPKCYQNGPYDILAFCALGWPLQDMLQGYVFDTLSSHAIIAPGVPHNLGFQMCVETHAPRWKTIFGDAKDDSSVSKFVSADPFERAIYNARDCYSTTVCALANMERLKTIHRGEQLNASLLARVKIAIKMQRRGNAVDLDALQRHRVELKQAKEDAARQLIEACAQLDFTLTAPTKREELCALFFERLHVKPQTFSDKTGKPRLDAKMLASLLAHPNRKIAMLARLVLRFRKYQKLLSTYVDGMSLEYPKGQTWSGGR